MWAVYAWCQREPSRSTFQSTLSSPMDELKASITGSTLPVNRPPHIFFSSLPAGSAAAFRLGAIREKDAQLPFRSRMAGDSGGGVRQ